MFRIIPREEKYFELFSQMAVQINQAAGVLKDLYENPAEAEKYAAELYQIEHKCDDLTHEVLKRLNKSFITPIDREDIHTLITTLDSVVDLMESAGSRVPIYGIRECSPSMCEMVSILVGASEAIGKAVATLPGCEGMNEHITEVHQFESKGDELYRNILKDLFEKEKDAITLIKHKEILEKIESAIDACQDAGNVLEGVAVKKG